MAKEINIGSVALILFWFCFSIFSNTYAANEQKVSKVEFLGFSICPFLIMLIISIPASVLCADSNSLKAVVIDILLFIFLSFI